VSLLVDWVLTKAFLFMSEPLDILDYLLALSAAMLFISGGLFAELWKKFRRREAPREEASIAELSDPDEKPRKEVNYALVQALGPSLIGLVGVVINAGVTVSSHG